MSDYINHHIVLRAYREGYFPMAESRYGEIYWHSPDPRAIFPLAQITVPKDIRKKFKKGIFHFTINKQFDMVIRNCAARNSTWISNEIIDVYNMLHYLGYAHSIETWQDEQLVGGLYGVAIGGAFFGESMFNTVSDASKMAFYLLVPHLISKGFILLDSQYMNPFTRQLGAVDIPREMYMLLLEEALKLDCSF